MDLTLRGPIRDMLYKADEAKAAGRTIEAEQMYASANRMMDDFVEHGERCFNKPSPTTLPSPFDD